MPDNIITGVNDMVPTRSVDKQEVTLRDHFDNLNSKYQHLDDFDSDEDDISYDTAHKFEDASNKDDIFCDDY